MKNKRKACYFDMKKTFTVSLKSMPNFSYESLRSKVRLCSSYNLIIPQATEH